jgi:hypothetical protein
LGAFLQVGSGFVIFVGVGAQVMGMFIQGGVGIAGEPVILQAILRVRAVLDATFSTDLVLDATLNVNPALSGDPDMREIVQ